MAIPDVKEKWSSQTNEVTIGATKEEGGTRAFTITVGGSKTLPGLDFEGNTGNKPVIAHEVFDVVPEDWPSIIIEPFKDVINNPAKWAEKCVKEYGAKMICLKLDGTHPDKGNKDEKHAEDVVAGVLKAVDVPLIIWGPQHPEKDKVIMPKVSQASKGEKVLLGSAREENYKTITAVAFADGHNLIAEAPLDINIGKQVNILISDMDFPLNRVVMFQTTGALGYGLEYAYSIQERERLAALSGDKMMAMPMLCTVGHEAWRAKEAKGEDEKFPEWGPREERGPLWEAMTGVALIQSGADILTMKHPKAIECVEKIIDELW